MIFEDLAERADTSYKDRRLEGYYNGATTPRTLGISLPENTQLLSVATSIGKLVIETISDAITPAGFLLGNDLSTPRRLRHWWQSQSMDSKFRLAVNEALVQGVCYWVLGVESDGSPRITVHTKDNVAVDYDSFGRVSQGVYVYQRDGQDLATHYLPGRNVYYRRITGGRWEPYAESETGSYAPLIVPMVNRERIDDIEGRSELSDILNLLDATSRSLTNLQVSQEQLAFPPKYLFGAGAEGVGTRPLPQAPSTGALSGLNIAEGPSEEDQKRLAEQQYREAVSQKRTMRNKIGDFITGPKGAEAGTFSASDPTPILSAISTYMKMIAAQKHLPPSTLGVLTDNPTSAEALQAAKNSLLVRTKTKQDAFGDVLETIARIVLEMMGELPEDIDALETVWEDASDISKGAKTAHMLNAYSHNVISAETAIEYLGLTPEQKARELEKLRTAEPYRNQLGG